VKNDRRSGVCMTGGPGPDRPPVQPQGEESRFQWVADHIRQVIFHADRRGLWTFLNAAWTELTGFTVAESLGTNFLRYVHPEDRIRHAEVFQPLSQQATDYIGLEARYLTKAGGYRWVEVFARLAVDEVGVIGGIFGTLTDITERKRADDELRAARARLHHLLASSPAVIYVAEADGECPMTFVSENITRVLGYAAADVLDNPRFWVENLHPEDAPRVLAGGRTLRVDGQQSWQYRFRHRDGSYRWIHDERRLVRDGADGAHEIVGSWVDITDRRRAEEERARLSMAVEQAGESIVITEPDGTIVYVNPAFERVTGIPRRDAVGRVSRILKRGGPDAEPAAARWKALERGEAWSGRISSRRADGGAVEEETTISPVRDAAGRLVNYVAVMRDVTHEHEMEEQLRHAQKMEAVGRLAGGVAHDFNNLLTVITGRCELLLRRQGEASPLARDLDLVLKTAQRAGALTRQLLAFSRKQVLAPRVVNLSAVVANMESMLRRLIGEDIELIIVPAPDVGRVKADPGQLEQVVMNLGVNARDAMPRGGRLVLETGAVEVDEVFARRHPGMRPGRYVTLTVSDSGCGMPPEVQAHIFEPFFTTKDSDRGTGLGLSTVYGIVTQSGGIITVESEVARGSVFRIFLPRIETPVDGGNGDAPAPRPRMGTETILLAEDEDEVRRLAREILRLEGYTTIEARHGHEALRIAEQYDGPIHLLMTDVVMPHMGGRELVERLRSIRPGIKVLFVSGYADETLPGNADGVLPRLLSKPFTADALLREVRDVLDVSAPKVAPRP
jgi:two-component system cell cycle sensor histidine kinase/response regulator CckA